MFRTLGLVISIGLADSLNPSTIGPALYLAARSHPRRRVLQFTASTFAVFFLGGVILVLGPGHAILALVPHPGPSARYILETIAGVALLVAAAVLWRRRSRGARGHAAPHESAVATRVAKFARNPVLLAATISVIELPTALPYFAAIAAVVGSGTGLPSQILLIAIYNACFVLPLLVIVGMLTVYGEQTTEILGRVRDYLRKRWPTVAAVVALIAGVFVVTLGVTGLLGGAPGDVGSFSRGVRHVIAR